MTSPYSTPTTDTPPSTSRRLPPSTTTAAEPPKRGARTATKPRATVKAFTDKDREKLKKRLTKGYKFLSSAAEKADKPALANALTEKASDCADAIIEAAEQSPRLRSLLFATMKTNAWLTLVAVHAPIIMAALPESALDKMMKTAMSFLFQREQTEDETQ